MAHSVYEESAKLHLSESCSINIVCRRCARYRMGAAVGCTVAVDRDAVGILQQPFERLLSPYPECLVITVLHNGVCPWSCGNYMCPWGNESMVSDGVDREDNTTPHRKDRYTSRCGSKKATSKPKAFARRATAEPIRPRPTRPSVDPRIRQMYGMARAMASGPRNESPWSRSATPASTHR